MNVGKIFMVLFLVGIAVICTAKLYANSITLSAVIPSPFGSFAKLKLIPIESLENEPYCDDENDIGMMYFDNGLGNKISGIDVCFPFSDGGVDWAVI